MAIIKNIVRSKTFYIGLLIKIVLISLIFPPAIENMYYPFLLFSVENFSFDPWTNWITAGGEDFVFPYGYSMWFSFLPQTAVCISLPLRPSVLLTGTVVLKNILIPSCCFLPLDIWESNP